MQANRSMIDINVESNATTRFFTSPITAMDDIRRNMDSRITYVWFKPSFCASKNIRSNGRKSATKIVYFRKDGASVSRFPNSYEKYAQVRRIKNKLFLYVSPFSPCNVSRDDCRHIQNTQTFS